jgi:hypothetical protein
MNFPLNQIRDQIAESWQNLTWDVNVDPVNGVYSNIDGCVSIREAIVTAERFGLFKGVTENLRDSSLFERNTDKIRVRATEATEIDSLATQLEDLLGGLKDALEIVLPKEDSSSINIKLPPVNDFDDLSRYSRDLHLAFTQVLYLDEVNGNVKIESVQNGSIWLNVVVEGATALALIGSLIWASAVIYKKLLEGKMMEQQLRALSIRTDSMSNVMDAQKEALAQVVQLEAEHIANNNFNERQPENVERIKNSIELFASLLDKGAEIHPSIGAPESIANLYPSMKALPVIESKIKKLSE